MSQDTLTLTGQRFQSRRFGHYLRQYCATNSSALISYYVIMVLGMILCQMGLPLLTRFKIGITETIDVYCNVGTVLCAIFGCIMMLEAGRRMYNRMARRDIKNDLMVPASQFEKACTWFVVWILGSIVVASLSFILADAIRAAVTGMIVPEGQKVTTVWQCNYEFKTVFIVFSALVCSQALFVLGGAVWYRNVWVKMIGVSFAIQWIVSFCIITVGMALIEFQDGILYIGDSMYLNGKNQEVDLNNLFTNIFIGLSWLYAVLAYLTAYYRNRQNGLNFRW